MKRIAAAIVIPFIALLSMVSCEKDDICVDAVTPQLIITFYDQDNVSDAKDVTLLRVYGEGLDPDGAVIDRTTTDSIAIPLKTLEDSTSYVFITNSGDDENDQEVGNADVLTFYYNINEIYVSRACGYKVNYSSLTAGITPDTDNWITNISIENNEVTDEVAAHVNIYH